MLSQSAGKQAPNLFFTGLGPFLAMWQEGDATAAAQLCPGGPRTEGDLEGAKGLPEKEAVLAAVSQWFGCSFGSLW